MAELLFSHLDDYGVRDLFMSDTRCVPSMFRASDDLEDLDINS